MRWAGILVGIMLTGCAPDGAAGGADAAVLGSLPATGYEAVLLDTWAADVDPESVAGVRVGGVEAYGLAVTEDGLLSAVVQGGAPGEAAVALTGADGSVAELGVLVYEAPADPVFERMVGFGASVSAGTWNSAPAPAAQLAGPTFRVAQAVGAPMPLPLFREGLWEEMQIDAISPSPACTYADVGDFILGSIVRISGELSDPDGGLDFRSARETPDVEARNVAVGNLLLEHIVHGVPEDDPTFAFLQYLSFPGDAEGFGDDTGPSQIERIEALEPSLVLSLDFFGNDLVHPLLNQDHVDLSQLTDEADFAADMEELVERLAATGAEVFLGNMPRPDRLPRVTTSGFTEDEMAPVLEAVVRFNEILDAEAGRHSNVHVVDLYTWVEGQLGGVAVGDQVLSFGPYGGLVSYDGLHFSDVGAALYAQFALEAIEAELGLTLPDVPVEAIAAESPFGPAAVEAAGFSVTDCL